MVLDKLKLNEPKTKEIIKLLTTLGVESSAIITTSEPMGNVVKSARNLPSVVTVPAQLLNVVDITSHKLLLMTEDAVRQVEEIWGKGAA
jgi:large subunit ribosomal protein L4